MTNILTMTALERQQSPYHDYSIQKKINGMGWSPECWGLCENRGQTQQQNFHPSDRDIRPKRRTKRIEEQAANAKLTTEMTIGP